MAKSGASGAGCGAGMPWRSTPRRRRGFLGLQALSTGRRNWPTYSTTNPRQPSPHRICGRQRLGGRRGRSSPSPARHRFVRQLGDGRMAGHQTVPGHSGLMRPTRPSRRRPTRSSTTRSSTAGDSDAGASGVPRRRADAHCAKPSAFRAPSPDCAHRPIRWAKIAAAPCCRQASTSSPFNSRRRSRAIKTQCGSATSSLPLPRNSSILPVSKSDLEHRHGVVTAPHQVEVRFALSQPVVQAVAVVLGASCPADGPAAASRSTVCKPLDGKSPAATPPAAHRSP